MQKTIVLLKRTRGLPPPEFQRLWLSNRATRVATIPGLRRYVQSHALLQGYAKGELLFDGIEELWFDDERALQAAIATRAWSDMLADADGITEAARTVVLPVEVHVIKDGPIPADAMKNIEFVNQRPGMERTAFRTYWREVHGPIASRIPVLRRYEQNHLLLSDDGRAPAPSYDGLAITWFQSTADMKQGTTTPEYATTRADEPNFLPDGHLPIIITREHEIRLPPQEARN